VGNPLFDFGLACYLKLDTPEDVVDILNSLTRTATPDPNNPPHNPWNKEDYPFLGSLPPTWVGQLFEKYDEHTDLPGETGATFRSVYRHNQPEAKGGAPVYGYMFSCRIFDTAEGIMYYVEFVKWLAPYSETRGVVGYLRFEYSDDPGTITLFCFNDGKAYWYDVPWDSSKLIEI
jgi:hypothetical protein